MSNDITMWTDSGTLTTTGTGDYYTYGTGNIYMEPPTIATPIIYPTPYMGSYKEENLITRIELLQEAKHLR